MKRGDIVFIQIGADDALVLVANVKGERFSYHLIMPNSFALSHEVDVPIPKEWTPAYDINPKLIEIRDKWLNSTI